MNMIEVTTLGFSGAFYGMLRKYSSELGGSSCRLGLNQSFVGAPHNHMHREVNGCGLGLGEVNINKNKCGPQLNLFALIM